MHCMYVSRTLYVLTICDFYQNGFVPSPTSPEAPPLRMSSSNPDPASTLERLAWVLLCRVCLCVQPKQKRPSYDPPTALTVLAVNVPLLLLYRKDDLLNISLPERYISAKGQDTQVSAAAVLIKDKPISLPERYICAKGQDTQVSAAAVLIKDKPIPNVFQYRTNCLNATPMFEYRATGTASVAMT